ncbi:MAG: aminotransferase class V-fold PLP-dependent enzyme, partial [Planctomycetota bacterium]
VMLANNEIGTIQPVAAIAEWCRQLDVCVHTDATQAVGRIPVDVDSLDVDLLSFSAHKMYGPKGVGGLFVRRRERRIRLQPQILGGGHQHNMRSGTLNVPGIVGMATALKVCLDRMPAETERLMGLRKSLWERLCSQAPFVSLNGPALDEHPNGALHRLPNNLNCSFYPVEGQSLMLEVPQIAVSSGSACTSAHPEPSHVLRAIGLSLDEARSSLRFGLGRINTSEEVLAAADLIAEAAERLRKLV